MNMKNFGKAKLGDIQRIEKDYNLNLPKDYKEFLQENNGGLFESYDAVKLKNIHENIHMRILYGTKTIHKNANIETWMDDSIIGSDVLENTVIIGDAIENGFIVMICDGEDAGIYYWDHSYEFEFSNDEANTYFIADTFTDFIKGIN